MASPRGGLLVVLLGLALGLAGAQNLYRWQCHGPYRGTHARLADIPGLGVPPSYGTHIFAIQSGAGFFKGNHDVDDETWWQHYSEGIHNLNVQTLAVTVITGGYVTAWVGSSSGLNRSTDYGQSWTSTGLLIGSCTSLAVQQLSLAPDWILCAGSTAGKVFLTTNGGTSWNDRTGDLPGNPVQSLAFQPNNPSVIYAGLSNGAVYKTTNTGTSWTQALAGDNSGRVTSIAVHPQQTSLVFAGYVPTETGGRNGVYRSTNGGANWTKTNLSRPVHCLAFNPEAPGNLYAGSEGSDDAAAVYHTTNNGSTWTARDAGIVTAGGPVTVESLIVVVDHDPLGLFAGTDNGGIVRSKDGGESWTWQYRGLAEPTAAVAAATGDPFIKYAGTGTGRIFRSLDDGWTWGQQNEGVPQNPPESPVTALAVTPGAAENNTLYAGVAGSTYKSTDGGTGWTLSHQPEPSDFPKVLDLVVDPQMPARVYANFGFFSFAEYWGLYRSTNAGGVWEQIDEPVGFRCFAVDPVNSGTLYAGSWGTQFTAALWKSTDGGGTWAGLGGAYLQQVRSMAVSPANPSVVYAVIYDPVSHENGLIVTSNGGAIWIWLDNEVAADEITTLAINPHWPETIYAGTQDHGIFRSHNGGATWSDVSDGYDGGAVTRLVIDPEDSSRVYAASENSGVFFRRFRFDLNMDSAFDYLDIYEYKWFLSEINLEMAGGPAAADINNDRKLNIVDLMLMRQAMH